MRLIKMGGRIIQTRMLTPLLEQLILLLESFLHNTAEQYLGTVVKHERNKKTSCGELLIRGLCSVNEK